MAKGKRGPIDYIRKRSGTKNLWFRYQFPVGMGWGNYERTLGTPDLKTARERAASHLMKCVAWVEEYKTRIKPSEERRQVTTLSWRYPPDLKGQHTLPDGRTIQVMDGMCLIAAQNGPVSEMMPNLVRSPVEGVFWTRAEYQAALDDGHLGDGQLLEWDCPGWRGEAIALPEGVRTLEQARALLDGGLIPDDRPVHRSKPRPCADDEFLEIYLKHRVIRGKNESEARRSWADFRMLTNGKPLKDCDRADGRKLADYYFAQGDKSGTVKKKIMWLRAMVRLAMMDFKPKITFNPFENVIPNIQDAIQREPMPEEDVKLIRENRHTFDDREWLLYLLCETTGMRREEAYSIDRDQVESGVRFVIVGKKTQQSRRRVPLPDAILNLPGFPTRINRPLFSPHITTEKERDNDITNLGREVLRQMKRIGVKTPGLHTLRHRAKDRLRAAGIVHEKQEELLGHEKKTVADGYGKGYPVRVLKRWVEHIGYTEDRGPLSFGPK
ncbi:tyrosine-type recombinase/integrase [Methylobacterium sp. WL18]|uniref:site-specific integrase n=1 Tax=Methylobacterium sp. WL18 TaxID=2603897 RepID=UPI0011C98832|nr:tyrosine-type recombinase/integrase [Methylobacterium sp. WL18]TXN65367.1 tyrosine-type recombinase/integrase [Methylobacterium sp. WL18]